MTDLDNALPCGDLEYGTRPGRQDKWDDCADFLERFAEGYREAAAEVGGPLGEQAVKHAETLEDVATRCREWAKEDLAPMTRGRR